MKKLLCILLVAPLFISCGNGGDGGPTAPTEFLEGTFVLQSVRVSGNGTDVTVSPPAATGEVVATADGRFIATFRMPSAGIDGSWTGSYTISGTELLLRYDNGTTELWTISADRNLISGRFLEEGFTVEPVYVRR